jgi:hypothetical protein
MRTIFKIFLTIRKKREGNVINNSVDIIKKTCKYISVRKEGKSEDYTGWNIFIKVVRKIFPPEK